MFCKYCGSKIDEEKSFCANCGKPIIKTNKELNINNPQNPNNQFNNNQINYINQSNPNNQSNYYRESSTLTESPNSEYIQRKWSELTNKEKKRTLIGLSCFAAFVIIQIVIFLIII
jgi:predicted amidophosphoribosyltransferase